MRIENDNRNIDLCEVICEYDVDSCAILHSCTNDK